MRFPATSTEILAIPADEPERLFSGNSDALRAEYLALAKTWHPDVKAAAADAPGVFAHILTLHEAARRKLKAGTWSPPGSLRIDTVEGRRFVLKTRKRRDFELGTVAIASRLVAYLVDRRHGALFANGLRQIRAMRYPDAATSAEMSRFMPRIAAVCDTATHHVGIIAKPEDAILLADLIAHLGGQVPPRHVAWMVSALLNLTCLHEVVGLTHNGLSASTVFVSPQSHAVFPLGGWWYAARSGARLEMLPDETFALLPHAMAISKRADIRLDLESVRAIALGALGDPTGLSLAGRPDLPKPMADYLRLPSPSSAIDDYRAWRQVLRDSFGPRRFVELPVTSSDVYS